MSKKIQLRRGLYTDLPTLDVGEPGFCTDTHGLYIGSSGGNQRINQDVINVENYGAKGDFNIITKTGTNNTAAINAALVSLPANGGIVQLGNGKRYGISGPINIPPFGILRGAGYEGSCIHALSSFSGAAMIQNQYQDGTQQMAAVESLAIVGEKTVASVPIGLLLKGIGQISYARDIVIYDCSGNGLVVDGGPGGAGYRLVNIAVNTSGDHNIIVQGLIFDVVMETITSQAQGAGKSAILLDGIPGGEGRKGIWLRNVHMEMFGANSIGLDINNMASVLAEGVDFIGASPATGDLVKIRGTSTNITLRKLYSQSLLNIINDDTNGRVYTSANYPYFEHYATDPFFDGGTLDLRSFYPVDPKIELFITNGLVALLRAYGATGEIRFGSQANNYYLSFYSNNAEVLRLDLNGNMGLGQTAFGGSATKTIALGTGIEPTTSPLDTFQMYSKDVVPGHAAPHFRTENADVIKLYKYLSSYLGNTPNSGDANTDNLIGAIRDLLLAMGLGASS